MAKSKKGMDLSSLLTKGKTKFGALAKDTQDDGFDWMEQRAHLLKGVLSQSEGTEASKSVDAPPPTPTPPISVPEESNSNATQIRHTNESPECHTLLPHKKSRVSKPRKTTAKDTSELTFNATQNSHTDSPHKLDENQSEQGKGEVEDCDLGQLNATQNSHTQWESPGEEAQGATDADAPEPAPSEDPHLGFNATQNRDTIKTHNKATQNGIKPHSIAIRHTVLPHKPHTYATHNATQNTHLSHTLLIEEEVHVRDLKGHALMIFEKLVDLFLEKKIRSILISRRMLSLLTLVSEGSVLTTTDRMKTKGFLIKEKIGKGKAAKLQIQIPDKHFFDFIQLKKGSNATRFSHTYNHTNASSKLVSANSTHSLTSETEEVDESSLKTDYSELDLSSVKHLGISEKQIADIRNQKLDLTATQLQIFVDQFAVYASNPENIKKVRNIRGLFVRMAQMTAKGENPLEGIKTSEDIELENLVLEKERIKREREELQMTLSELAFEEWWSLLPQAKRNEIVPLSAVVRENSEAQRRMGKVHFLSHVWDPSGALKSAQT